MSNLTKERLDALKLRIREACVQSGRKEDAVLLVAVSKTKSWEEIEAFAELGVKDFGENYVQEALEKQRVAHSKGLNLLKWHFIGTLQSNKAKFIPGAFNLFHSLDSFSLAQKLNKAALSAGLIQECLLEVNVDGEESKGGLASDSLACLLDQLNDLGNLKVSGLMCIPAPIEGRELREPFARLRQLMEQLNAKNCYRTKLERLSMGMSADFEAAILEGATIVRLGTVLFGERKPK